MRPHELIFSQDGATGYTNLLQNLFGPFSIYFRLKFVQKPRNPPESKKNIKKLKSRRSTIKLPLQPATKGGWHGVWMSGSRDTK